MPRGKKGGSFRAQTTHVPLYSQTIQSDRDLALCSLPSTIEGRKNDMNVGLSFTSDMGDLLRSRFRLKQREEIDEKKIEIQLT